MVVNGILLYMIAVDRDDIAMFNALAERGYEIPTNLLEAAKSNAMTLAILANN